MKPLAAILLALLPLAAQEAAPAPARSGRVAKLLDLSPDQQAKLSSLRTAHRVALAPKVAALREARQALAQGLRNPATPEAQVRALYQRASDARLNVLLARRAGRAELKAVLTPVQQEKAKALWQERRGGWREGHRGVGAR